MRHKIIFSAIIPYFIFTACSTQEEWTSLFNGTDLSGWEVKAKPEDQGKDFWVAGDGYIEANSIGQPDHDYIWLYSQQEYDDFEIKFKFQAFVESPGNSGIQLRSRYDSVTYWLNRIRLSRERSSRRERNSSSKIFFTWRLCICSSVAHTAVPASNPMRIAMTGMGT